MKTPEMKPEPPEVNRSPSEKLCKCFPDSGGENAKALRPTKAGYTCTEYEWNLRYDVKIAKKHGLGGRKKTFKGYLGIC